MLRKSFGLVFVRLRVRARNHVNYHEINLATEDTEDTEKKQKI
jgi:hypothetical protein